MHHRLHLFARCTSATLAFVLVLTVLLVGPAPRALATAPETTLFRAEFDNAPLGLLSSPLTVETGALVPQGRMSVVAANGGRALRLEGGSVESSAFLQWSNFPGGLPNSAAANRMLRIKGDFSTTISNAQNGSVGLLSGANFFEFFTFDVDGKLTRRGTPLGLSYTVSTTVRLDARILLRQEGNLAEIILSSGGGVRTIVLPLDAAFSAATLNQLRLQAFAGIAHLTADRLSVKLQPDEDDDDDEDEEERRNPPVIIIRDSDIEQEIERIGALVFVSIKITIVNTGGKARGSYLILNLDDFDDDFDLDDLSFLEGLGYVAERDDDKITIGLGRNNVILGGDKIKVKIKFKAKKSSVNVKITARFTLNFSGQTFAFQPVVVVAPVVVPIVTPVVVVQRLPLSAIDVRFVGAWRSRGGLEIFGLPISQPITLPNGIIVQYFERTRLEYHPELAGTAYEVLLGLLGVELGYTRPMTATTAPTSTTELRWYFPASGHLIARPFRTFWQSRGGLPVFGLPISPVLIEDGRQVQYFERARLELHPELAGTRYEVQLGHLGVLVLQAKGDD